MHKVLAFRGRLDIYGAGLAGLVLALTMYREGYAVRVFEKYPEEAIGKSDRAYTMQLFPKGLDAMQELGVWDGALQTMCQPLRGFRIFTPDGHTLEAPYAPDKRELLVAINRQDLLFFLREKIREAGVPVVYGTPFDASACEKDGFIMGADGVHSAVRDHISSLKHPGITPPAPEIADSYFVIQFPGVPEGFDPTWTGLWPLPPLGFVVGIVDGKGLNLVVVGKEDDLKQHTSFESRCELLKQMKLPIPSTLIKDAPPIGHIYTLSHDLSAHDNFGLMGDALLTTPPALGVAFNAANSDIVAFRTILRGTSEDIREAYALFSSQAHPVVEAYLSYASTIMKYFKDGFSDPVVGMAKDFFYQLQTGPFSGRFVEPPLRVNLRGTDPLLAEKLFETQETILKDISKFLNAHCESSHFTEMLGKMFGAEKTSVIDEALRADVDTLRARVLAMPLMDFSSRLT